MKERKKENRKKERKKERKTERKIGRKKDRKKEREYNLRKSLMSNKVLKILYLNKKRWEIRYNHT